jgi:cell pole-organizing protein PopZ
LCIFALSAFDSPETIGNTLNSGEVIPAFGANYQDTLFMAQKPSEQEPSIEEILASIRQIISEDEENDTDEKEVVEDPVHHEPDDVLELTEDDLVEEEPEDEEEEEEPEIELDMRDREEKVAKPAPEPPPPPPPPAPEPPPKAQAAPTPSEILSSRAQSEALGSLSKLTSRMPVNSTRSYNGVTLEDIVRELLHPMLREWMDDNLPPMVERIVQKELEKLARRALDE